ncbi:MAG TPA: hypothetical protein VKM55_16805 [Candidatus Lokiarchaeia archaeon]|nr:hypothetical protein [Candidatus Lokiarchaeia archaeon]
MLYRSRWNIGTAFWEMNRLGIVARCQQSGGGFAAMGAFILMYEIW